ncbi:hypothetical protein ACFO4N_12845 [Camelliibacillus cellulosilyticus]|uniref:Uncharacterized protein n=1 Tax=Camelliibacillus cellulosilyticus TaxID=2174486 RepID=A0ABV9GQT1_9BACL
MFNVWDLEAKLRDRHARLKDIEIAAWKLFVKPPNTKRTVAKTGV